jgi:hypothetical protein
MTHLLDDIRHALAIMWTYSAWAGNISAGIIVAVVASLFWPPMRRRLDAFVKGHIIAANADIHRKLDHIIRHHPDIPDLEEPHHD